MKKFFVPLLFIFNFYLLSATTFVYKSSDLVNNHFEKDVDSSNNKILKSSFSTDTFSNNADLDYLATFRTINSVSRDTLQVFQDSSGMGVKGLASANGWPSSGKTVPTTCYDIARALLSFNLNGTYAVTSNSAFKSSIINGGIYLHTVGNYHGGVSLAIKVKQSNTWYVSSSNKSVNGDQYELRDNNIDIKWYELNTESLLFDSSSPVDLDFDKDFISGVGIYHDIYGFPFKDYESYHIGVSDFELTNLQAIPESKTYALTLGIISIIFFLFKRRTKLISHN